MAKDNSCGTPKNFIQLVIEKEIGFGKFKVVRAKSLEENETYAVKLFPLNQSSQSIYLNEKRIHSKLQHKNIINYRHSSNVTNKNFNYDMILTEYAPHGNFYDLVSNRGLQNEKIMRTYFRQLIEGLEYLHSRNVGHLDIKLDNLLLGNEFELKIADFDQSQEISSDSLKTRGTAFYRSPEIIEGKCKDFIAADIYSAGVVLYAFRAGCFPFFETNEQSEHNLIHYDLFMKDNQLFWKEKVADRKNKDFFSEDFIELVNGMLEKDPKKRFTIQDIKNSRWFNGSICDQDELKRLMERVCERILFTKTNRRD